MDEQFSICCEVTVKAKPDDVTPPDLSVAFKVKGVKVNKNATIALEKKAKNVMECVCGVFYRRKEINFWMATIAFFPKKHLNVS